MIKNKKNTKDMYFFYKFFNKDIIFLKNLSDNQKKLLIYFLGFFFIFSIFFIKLEKFLFFLFLLLILLIWKIFFEIFSYIVIDNNKLKTIVRGHDHIFDYILKILLFIQKWKNPILIVLLKLDKFLLKIIRSLIYNLRIKYEYDLTASQISKIFYIYYFVINIMFGPLKLLFGFFYIMINRMIEFPFSIFLVVRMIGFILSMLIFSNLLNILYIKLGLLNLIMFIYIFLIVLSCFVKYIDRDFKYLKISYINNFINTDYLIYLRNYCTFFGFFILTIGWYKSTLIDKKYIDVIGSFSKIELEEGFYKYWENYKRNNWLKTTNLWKDIKNRPSFFLYLNLMVWLNVSPIQKVYAPSALLNIIFIQIKVDYLKIELLEDLKKDINFLYNFFLLRLKLLLFIIWDISDYIEADNCNFINYKYNNEFKIYDIKGDFNIFDFTDIDNFKVEKKKEDLPFYDLENNMAFFDRFYLVVGLIPYNEDPSELIFWNDNMIIIEDLANNVESRLNRFYNFTIWGRGHFFHIIKKQEQEMLLIENMIKDWIINFLKETRKEWYLSLKNESIEDRNWRLLKDIEFLLLKK